MIKNSYLCNMENDSKNKEVEVKDFTTEYNEVVKSTEQSVVVDTQWAKDGDYFQKLSMYDNSYVQVETLGSTTLIKSL
ncbi:MAG: hypothetical protein U9R42_12725 [Bacteroidota bacterium]|nr:hypothetical protein [Bacteroidota bacterium]